MSKKLNLAMITESVKKFDEKEKITLSDGNYTYIYPNFSPSKISEVIKETILDYEKARKAGLDFSGIDHGDWLYFNIIRFFADLNIPNDIKKKSQIFVKLIDSDYFADIIKSFPQSSIEKVVKAVDSVNKNLDLMNNRVNETTINKVVDDAVNSTDTES